jgi:hypothetical protein
LKQAKTLVETESNSSENDERLDR